MDSHLYPALVLIQAATKWEEMRKKVSYFSVISQCGVGWELKLRLLLPGKCYLKIDLTTISVNQ